MPNKVMRKYQRGVSKIKRRQRSRNKRTKKRKNIKRR